VNSERAAFDSAAALANPELLSGMLAHWANYMIHKALAQLQENVNNAQSQFDGWQQSQVHFLNDASIAFGYFHAAQIFYNQI
jgi:hypothetical protein